MSDRDSAIVLRGQPIKPKFLRIELEPISLISPSEPTAYVVFPMLKLLFLINKLVEVISGNSSNVKYNYVQQCNKKTDLLTAQALN